MSESVAPIVIDVAGVVDKITPEMLAALDGSITEAVVQNCTRYREAMERIERMCEIGAPHSSILTVAKESHPC